MKEIYDSSFHHPLVAYVCTALMLFALARRLRFLYAYLLVFGVIILADATATGGISPIPMGTTAYTFASVVFIILGDLRYFLLVERWAKPTASMASVLGVSSAVALVVPLGSSALMQVVPAMREDRVLYIVYETTMVFLVPAFAFIRSRTENRVDPAMQRAVAMVAGYFAALYAGWALSDIAILAGVESGHLARIVPNVMYYGGFLPFVFWVAPGMEKPRGS